jgi:two-component system, NtrC family, sensor kinase
MAATTATDTVLIVEDNPAVQATLELILGAMGYAVDLAGSGDEALPLLVYRDYTAVVCDVMMPGMQGDELFWACQARRPEIARRFVFLTGSLAVAAEPCPLERTGQPWLAKPCRIHELRDAIASVAISA